MKPPDTSWKTRSWIGALGLMVADPPPEQTCQISKAGTGQQMHVRGQRQRFVSRRRCTPLCRPSARWGPGPSEPFLLPLEQHPWGQNFCRRDYANLLGFIYRDSSNKQTLKRS